MKKAILVAIFSFLFPFFGFRVALAEDFVFVNWQVQSYAPESYSFYAKNPILPGSTVDLTVNFFKDLGKGAFQAVNLQDYTIRWFNNSVKIAETKGVPILSYSVGKFTKDSSLNLLVQVVGPESAMVGQKQISIPIKRNPEITLHLVENGKVSSYSQPEETFSGMSGQELEIVAKPYFFNVKNIYDINFQWFYRLQKIDNPEKNQAVFKAKLPQNKVTDIFSVFVQNSKSEVEFVKKNFYLSNK